jgi:TetR/AcrR family transcriptional regulator, copper-responsive repressor
MISTPSSLRPRGRPRAFDKDTALQAAVRLFWSKGFQRTSISDLTTALGVNPPSLYAAFGDKQQIYTAALEVYQRDVGCFLDTALASPGPARAAVHALLATAACVYTAPETPPGCMVLQSDAVPDTEGPGQAVVAARQALAMRIAARIRADHDAATMVHADGLGAFFLAILQGMSAQARDGARHADLLAIGDRAILAWPADRPRLDL